MKIAGEELPLLVFLLRSAYRGDLEAVMKLASGEKWCNSAS
jgi:hypothetical protein